MSALVQWYVILFVIQKMHVDPHSGYFVFKIIKSNQNILAYGTTLPPGHHNPTNGNIHGDVGLSVLPMDTTRVSTWARI